jgi:hypothetical protein
MKSTVVSRTYTAVKNGKSGSVPAESLFPAFPEPAGWALRWDGHALTQPATNSTRPNQPPRK